MFGTLIYPNEQIPQKVPVKLIRVTFPEIDYFVHTNKVQKKYIFGVTEYNSIFPFAYEATKDVTDYFNLSYVSLATTIKHAKKIVDFIADNLKHTNNLKHTYTCSKCRCFICLLQ